MRELVDKRLMLEDVKSWVAMDSYEQHLINNMLAWIENLPTVEVSDGECISRRAAIDAVSKAREECRGTFARCEKKLLALPSVHPEIIRCGDCIHYNKHKDCIKYQRDGFCYEWARNTYKYWYCSRAERSVKYE